MEKKKIIMYKVEYYKISEEELLMLEQAMDMIGKSKYRDNLFSDIRSRKIDICQYCGEEL
jgi:hypothetical protein